MKSSRRVVCLERRKVGLGIVLKRVTTNRSGSERVVHRRSRSFALALALQCLLFYGPLPAGAQSEKPVEVKRPELQIGNGVRFDEDWSVLRGVDLSKTDDFWDRLKFIPFNQDGSIYLTIGGQ